MKILFVLGWYYPAEVGGVARITHTYASGLAKLGHQVEVWTSDYLNGRVQPAIRELRPVVLIDGVTVRYHKSLFFEYQAQTKRVFSPALSGRCRSLELNEFDLVHIPESRALLTLMAFLGRKRLANGVFVHSAFGALGSERLTMIQRLYDRCFLRPFFSSSVSLFLAQTEHERGVYKKFVPTRKHQNIQVLPLCTNVAENLRYSVEQKGQLKSKLNLVVDKKVILFLGRLTKNKGIDRLIMAFHQLENRGEYHLAIVGYDEGIKEALLALISDLDLNNLVTILPSCHGTERFGYYADASVFAITSAYFEETSLASLEALSIGTPCVVTPQVEIPYIEEYRAGRLVKNEFSEIAEAISDVCSNNQDYGANAYRLAVERFDEQNVVTSLERLYLDTIQGRHGL